MTLTLRETFGLSPLPVRAREAWLAVRGDAGVPPTRFGISSLGIFHPRLSLRTWLGKRRADRLVPISCLYNRTPTPLEEGWSVRKTQVRDFRGGTLTYDTHNGTDLAVPVGTVVVAAAAGVVLRVSSEFNRGGLKVFVDHGSGHGRGYGGGLITTYNHLARALVEVGDVVERGQPIALSGYSGIDAVVAFPWSVPHVHFNVWLDGDYVDPFAAAGETPLWLHGNDARPAPDLPDATDASDVPGVPEEPAVIAEPPLQPTAWDPDLVAAAIDACTDPDCRDTLLRQPDLARRAMDVLFYANYYPTRFTRPPSLYREPHPRAPYLTLPFRPADCTGITFADAAD